MRGSHVLRELIRCMAEKLEDFLSAFSPLRRYRDTAMAANSWLSESLKQANVWRAIVYDNSCLACYGTLPYFFRRNQLSKETMGS